jgi:hypothetical protein
MRERANGTSAYSDEERRAIRRMLDAGDTMPVCPRGQQKMHQEGPLAGGGSIGLVWRMSCEACNTAALVAESISRPRPEKTGP